MFSCKKQNKTVSQFKAYYVGYNKALLFSKSTSLLKENTHLRQQPHKSIPNCSMETHTQCTEAWYQSDDHNSGSFRCWVFFFGFVLFFCFYHMSSFPLFSLGMSIIFLLSFSPSLTLQTFFNFISVIQQKSSFSAFSLKAGSLTTANPPPIRSN